MRDTEKTELKTLYTIWDTEKLENAILKHRSEYAPEALEIMSQVLTERGVAMQAIASDKGLQNRKRRIVGFFIGGTVAALVYLIWIAWLAAGLGHWPSSFGAILFTLCEGLLFFMVGGFIGAC